MTTQYGIGVTKNRYELFDIDDEDPLEILKFHEQEKEARKKTKQSEKENKGNKDTLQKPKPATVRKGIKETQILKPHDTGKGKDEKTANTTQRGYDRGERKFIGDNREDRNNRRNRGSGGGGAGGGNDGGEYQRDERSGGGGGGAGIDRKDNNRGNANITSGGTTVTFNEQGNHGLTVGRGGLQRGSGGRVGGGQRGGGQSARGFRGGGRGGMKGPGNTFDNRPGRRDYDRQQVVNDKNELNNTTGQTPDDSNNWIQEKQEGDANPETNCGVTTTETDEVGGVEEERKELTLDEWKAMKAPRQKPTYNLRKAGEGEDLSQWKKMYALQRKKDGDDDEEEEEYEYESCEYPQRVGRQKHVLDIDIHFKDTRSGGRSRGGRGTGRGGPRMGQRVGQSGVVNNTSDRHAVHGRDNKSAPKVDDEHDFPSLG